MLTCYLYSSLLQLLLLLLIPTSSESYGNAQNPEAYNAVQLANGTILVVPAPVVVYPQTPYTLDTNATQALTVSVGTVNYTTQGSDAGVSANSSLSRNESLTGGTLPLNATNATTTKGQAYVVAGGGNASLNNLHLNDDDSFPFVFVAAPPGIAQQSGLQGNATVAKSGNTTLSKSINATFASGGNATMNGGNFTLANDGNGTDAAQLYCSGQSNCYRRNLRRRQSRSKP
jgi:hypothetical protein